MFLVKQTMFLKLNMVLQDEYLVLWGNKPLFSFENPVRKKRDIVIEGKLLQVIHSLFNFNLDSYETAPRDVVVWHCHFGKYLSKAYRDEYRTLQVPLRTHYFFLLIW